MDSLRVSDVFSSSVEASAVCGQSTRDSKDFGVSARIALVGANISPISNNVRVFDIFSGYQQLGELPTGPSKPSRQH